MESIKNFLYRFATDAKELSGNIAFWIILVLACTFWAMHGHYGW
jgi:hypothetical protein|nr:MAG TPA: hypothetical protein [Caudoviricetes sp.]